MTQPAQPFQVNVQPAPPTAHQDGINRAARSIIGGVLSAAFVAGGAGLLNALGTVHWTRAYWISVGTLAASSLVYGAVAYAMRRFAPPQV